MSFTFKGHKVFQFPISGYKLCESPFLDFYIIVHRKEFQVLSIECSRKVLPSIVTDLDGTLVGGIIGLFVDQ